MIACASAAIAIDARGAVGTSQIRNSSVPKVGCGRRSHQIFLPLSMQCSSTSVFDVLSYSLHDWKWSGMPVRGKRRNTVVRNDFSPVSRPIQNGELVDSASRCGRK